MNAWFGVKKYLVASGFYVLSQAVAAAQLNATIVDAQGAPLDDAVAALIPAQQPDYNSLPTAIMDQRQNMFVPKVLAIRTNTQVRFPNSDDVRHHVYSFSPAKKFELRLYHGMTAEPVVFDKPGTVVLGCNIHDSMVAYIYVVDTPYFAKSDASGQLHITAPAGDYKLQVYHPRLSGDYPESSLQLNDATPSQQTITLQPLSDSAGDAPTDELSTLF